MMDTIERIFEGLFNSRNITAERLVNFANDQVSKTEANNPAGKYTAIIADTKTKAATLQTYLDNKLNSQATGKGGTVEKNQTRTECETFISQSEGLIKYHYAVGSPVYVEFYPSGISGFNNATDAEFRTMMNVYATKADAYKAKLGNDFATAAAAKRNAYNGVSENHTDDNSDISTARSNELAADHELGMQLTANVLTIALNNLGNVAAVKTYFNTSLLYAPHHQYTFNLNLKSGETQSPIEKQFTAQAKITITSNQTIEVSLSNAKDTMLPNPVKINSNEQTTIHVSDFNVDLATHHFVVIKNTGLEDAEVKVELL